jgi:hypothetical protein
MRASLSLVLAVLPVLAVADVIHLADGTKRHGRVVETTPTEVVVDVGAGNVSLHVRIPRADVVRIEHKATANDLLMADYGRRLARAGDGGADAWHALGAWCADQRVLKAEARAAYERAVAIDPDHAEAHAALGHVKLNEAWMTRKRAVALLAPELAEALAQARQLELTARRDAEEAKTQVAEAHKRVEELQAQVVTLQREAAALRQRLATPPPPPPEPRPRVIYRPIIIRPRPRPRKPATSAGAQSAPPPPAAGAESPPPKEDESEKAD